MWSIDNLYSPPRGREKKEKNNNNLTKLNYYNIHSTISPRITSAKKIMFVSLCVCLLAGLLKKLETILMIYLDGCLTSHKWLDIGDDRDPYLYPDIFTLREWGIVIILDVCTLRELLVEPMIRFCSSSSTASASGAWYKQTPVGGWVYQDPVSQSQAACEADGWWYRRRCV